MFSPLGKELRSIRLSKELRLLDLAEILGVSSAFVSAIERGSKKAPEGFVKKVIRALDLSSTQSRVLLDSESLSKKEFKITANTSQSQEMVGLMARNVDKLDQVQLEKIKRILEKLEMD